VGDVERNGPDSATVANILNVSFEGVEGESLVAALGALAVATGSACTSAMQEPSFVLRALGRRPALAQSSLRLSLGRTTTADEVDRAAATVVSAVRRLRAVAAGEPLPHPPPDGETPEFDALSPRVRQLFVRLPGAGRLPDGTPGLVIGEAGGEAAEARVRFELAVAGNTVKEARFRAWGCPHTLAVAAWIAGQLPGRRREALVPGTPEDWRRELAVPVEKLGRLLVVEDALRSCLEQWFG
jgi:cysteine desulfurase